MQGAITHQLQERQRPQRRQRHGLEGPCVRYLTNTRMAIYKAAPFLQRTVVKYRMACPVRMVGIESPGIESLLQGPIPFLSGFIWLVGWLLDPLAHTSQY